MRVHVQKSGSSLNEPVRRALLSHLIRREIASSGEEHEREADRVASDVIDGKASGVAGPASRARGGGETIETKRVPGLPQETSVPAVVREVTRSSGQVLDTETRELMESRFGHDFSHVSIHLDAQAAASAQAVHAHAYTVGQHIAFGAGQYRPHTVEGQRLLAHELTHTLQQRTAAPGVSNGILGQSASLQRQASGEDPAPAGGGSPRGMLLLQAFLNDKPAFKRLESGIFDREADDGDAIVETVHANYGAIPWTFTIVTNLKEGLMYVRQWQDGTQIVNHYQGPLPIDAGGVSHMRHPTPCADLVLPVVTDTTRWRVTEVPPELTDAPAVPYAPVAAAITNTTTGISAITKHGSGGPVGEYTYEFTFCLCEGFSSPVLDLQLATDNDSEIRLNGNVIGATSADLGPATLLTSAAQAGFFKPGPNKLTFRVRNRGSRPGLTDLTPTGLGVNGTLTAKNGQCY